MHNVWFCVLLTFKIPTPTPTQAALEFWFRVWVPVILFDCIVVRSDEEVGTDRGEQVERTRENRGLDQGSSTILRLTNI